MCWKNFENFFLPFLTHSKLRRKLVKAKGSKNVNKVWHVSVWRTFSKTFITMQNLTWRKASVVNNWSWSPADPDCALCHWAAIFDPHWDPEWPPGWARTPRTSRQHWSTFFLHCCCFGFALTVWINNLPYTHSLHAWLHSQRQSHFSASFTNFFRIFQSILKCF